VGVDDGSRESVDLLGAGVLTLASLSWAVGSLYVKHAPRPSSGLYGAATQMIMGGVWLLAASLLVGEFTHFNPAQISTKSALGFAYLTTFGSLVGFTAYFYLLAHTTAAKASTYAYINPVVAVFLGWLLAHEPVTMHTIISAVVILAGVAIITIARDTEAMEPAEEQAVA
jgi:drug/metabolite transporter (DMT)-like permease